MVQVVCVVMTKWHIWEGLVTKWHMWEGLMTKLCAWLGGDGWGMPS